MRISKVSYLAWTIYSRNASPHLSSQVASMTSNMKHGPPVRMLCSGRASSPVIWSAAVGWVLAPDMRSAWTLSWASLGMYGACEHESFCCVRACSAFCQLPPHVGASWSKYGRWELRSAADEGLCHGFSQNCLVCRFLVSNLFTVFE